MAVCQGLFRVGTALVAAYLAGPAFGAVATRRGGSPFVRDPAARALLARCRLADGDLSGAEAIARQMLVQHDEDPDGLALLAGIELARGRPGRALPWVRRSLERNPFDATALAFLARIEAAGGRAPFSLGSAPR